MWNKSLLFVLLIFSSTFVKGQGCAINISGKVVDVNDGSPLEIVNIYVKEIETGTYTDINGEFAIDNICPGSYHFIFSHVGCNSKEMFLEVKFDTTLIVDMDHNGQHLNEVLLRGRRETSTTQKSEIIKQQLVLDNANEDLTTLISALAGVNALKNGSGISKPIVQGLYGNRLTILNNGIPQSGQQWGNDHSPEIDPLSANQIRVVKGAATVEYMGPNMGSVVSVEPKMIDKDPHLHGRVTYLFNTNGRGHSTNANLQKYSNKFAWQLNATYKRNGDKKAPNYLLNNTGNQEANITFQLNKSFSTKLNTDLYFSSFNSILGILRGAHLGNINDLTEAFRREEPFFTEPTFSYHIDAPRQSVSHNLLKLHSKYFVDNNRFWDFTIASQINDRNEYDVRRSGRSDIPALSLLQYSHFVEAKYQWERSDNINFKSGIQFNVTDNTNRPETGILPLIPDYRSYESGLYFFLSKKLNNSMLEGGIRYSNVMIQALTITNDIPRKIERYDRNFNNLSGSIGWKYPLSSPFTISCNLGYAQRNPAVNELYSRGLHQGVSGIEQGNVNLLSEQSLKSTLVLNGKVNKTFSFELTGYYQSINDYIYLQPTDELRLTIRGAFPVFEYRQDDASILGFDFSGLIDIGYNINLTTKISFLRGDNISQNTPLVYMPSNNALTGISYEYPRTIQLFNGRLNRLQFAFNHQIVLRQKHLLSTQDIIPTPEGYQLFNFELSTNFQIKHLSLRFISKIENIANVKYRDYLNRQRYFADDLGRSVIFGLTLKF